MLNIYNCTIVDHQQVRRTAFERHKNKHIFRNMNFWITVTTDEWFSRFQPGNWWTLPSSSVVPQKQYRGLSTHPPGSEPENHWPHKHAGILLFNHKSEYLRMAMLRLRNQSVEDEWPQRVRTQSFQPLNNEQPYIFNQSVLKIWDSLVTKTISYRSIAFHLQHVVIVHFHGHDPLMKKNIFVLWNNLRTVVFTIKWMTHFS